MDQHQPIGDSFSIGRSIGNGMKAVRVAFGPMWLGGLLLSITDGCNGTPPLDLVDLLRPSGDQQSSFHALPGRLLGAAQNLPSGIEDLGDWASLAVGLVLAFVLAALLFAAALFALSCFLQTGFIRLHVNILEHASDEIGPLFSGKDRFWAMAGYKTLGGLAVSAAAIATAWPGGLLAAYGFMHDDRTLIIAGSGAMAFAAVPAMIYVGLGVYLGDLAVALEGASPVHALRRAWALADGNRLPLFAFAVLCFLIQAASMLGLLLCCVGALATVPLGRAITAFAKTESYLLFTRGSGQAAHFKLWQEPRPAEPASERVQGWGAAPGSGQLPPGSDPDREE